MGLLKYKIIKAEDQYWEYCNILEALVSEKAEAASEDEIELLTVLIEKWDAEHNKLTNADPVELLKYLMSENNLKAKDLVELLGVGKSTVSEILNYRKGFSKDIIRKISERFKMNQEAFNRPYNLVNIVRSGKRTAKNIGTKKKKLVTSH